MKTATPFRPTFPTTEKELWLPIIEKMRELGVEKCQEIFFDGGDVRRDPLEKSEVIIDGDTIRYNNLSTEVRTLPQLLEYHEVNAEDWNVDQLKLNKWQQGSKLNGVVLVKDLYQIKATLTKKKKTADVIVENIVDILNKKVDSLKPFKYKNRKFKKRSLLVEPFITDLHVGKVAKDWTIKQSLGLYERILHDLLCKVDESEIDRFLLPVGNDLINIDNLGNTTFRGTPQMAGEYYETMIAQTEEMLMRVIHTLAEIAPVDVVCVSGNHDRQSIFHIGRTLWGAFKDVKQVSIINDWKTRYYYKWRNVMVGFTHGNNEKLDSLPKIAAAEQPQMWGATKTREFHIGHFHKSDVKKTIIKHQEELRFEGMTVRICPTICPTDRWHNTKGYVGGLRRSQSFIFSESGVDTINYFNI